MTDVSLCKSGPLFSPQRAVTGSAPPDFSTDSLNLDKDEWLDEEAAATQLLLAVDCRTNTTNYTLAWSSASGTDQDADCNEPGIHFLRLFIHGNLDEGFLKGIFSDDIYVLLISENRGSLS